MNKFLLLAATALTAHAAVAQAPSQTSGSGSGSNPTPQTNLAAASPSSSSSSPSAGSTSANPSGSSATPSGTLATSSPSITTTANSAGGCQVPAQAASAGYNQMTYGPDMALGANWFPGDNVTSGLTQNSDGSISIRGGDGNNYNRQLVSGDAKFGGGAYVQATLSFQNPTGGWYQGADGWPAFWGWATDPSGHVIEPDFFEFMTAGNNQEFDFNIHEWGSSGQLASDGGKASLPSGFDASQPHTYGFLWVPASGSSPGSASMFVDGNQVGPVHTWSPGGSYSTFDDSELEVIFGTGSANPMTVYNTQVWQKDASKDTGIVGTSVGNSGGACPTVVSASGPSPSTPSGSGTTPGSGGSQSSAPTNTASATPGGSSSGIVPQTTLASAAGMGPTGGSLPSMSGGEWGSFKIGETNYDVTIIDPPGKGPSYEVLIADGATPYIIALPEGVGSGAPSSLGGTGGSWSGSGTVSSQFGNPTSTDMSASPAGYQTRTDPTTGAQTTTTYNASSNTGGPLSGTINNYTGGSGSTMTPATSGGSATDPSATASNETGQTTTASNGGGGRRGHRSQSNSTSTSGSSGSETAANTGSGTSVDPAATGSGSANSGSGSAGAQPVTATGSTGGSGGGGSGGGGISAAAIPSTVAAMNQTAQNSGEFRGGTITLSPGDITPGSGGSVTDKNGDVWTLGPLQGDMFAGVPMGLVTKNGTPLDQAGGGGYVAALRLDPNGNAVWENAKGGGWWNETTFLGNADPGTSL